MSELRTAGAFIPRPMLFWFGVALTSAGVAEHVWVFVRAAPMHFRLAQMPMSSTMWVAMVAITVGVVLSGYALRQRPRRAGSAERSQESELQYTTMTSRRRLIGVLALAMLLDQMKPATLAFIEPGIRAEYHISQAQVAWLPTVALSGTVVGSLAWGRAADRVGRRATILTASLLFLGTTVCGAMPSFAGNLIMCALMGMAAGGMLPVVYALLAECLPDGERAASMVLLSGLTTTGGYMAASGLAVLLIPLASWRVLWFAQLPLVIFLLIYNRSIPESAAFHPDRARPAPMPVSALLRHPHRGATILVSSYALAWGLIYWGFMTFLPANLARVHGGMSSSTLLFVSSLLAIPACAAAAFLYARWSAKGAMVAYAMLTAGALVAFAACGMGGSPLLTMATVVLLLAGASGVLALIGPFTAEVYPTYLRGTAGGLAAAVSKSGGAFGPPLIAVLLGIPGGMRSTALLVALPMAAAAVALIMYGHSIKTTVATTPELYPVDAVPAVENPGDH